MIRLDLQNRITGLMGRGQLFQQEREAQSKQIVKIGKLEESFLDTQIERWPKFHDLTERGTTQLPSFPEFIRDIFFSLYLYDPQFRRPDQMVASHRPNAILMAQTQNLPIWKDARSFSVLDKVKSMIGLVYVAETLLNEMPKDMEEKEKQAQEDRPEQDENLDDLMRQMQDPNLTDEQAEALSEQVEQLLQEMEETDSTGMNEDKARRMMKNALDKAEEAMEEFTAQLVTWGTEPGEIGTMPIDQAMSLYERMRSLPNLKKLTDEFGRMREIAHEASQQLNAREAQEIVDVTTGRSLSGMLPSERMNFVDEDLELLVYLRYAQDALLEWEYSGRDNAGQGPFILVVDVSGSTAGAREIWGKAFCLAAIDMAARQRRDVGIIFFDTEVKPEGCFYARAGQVDLALKVQIAEYYTGGGTAYAPALEIALQNIEANVGPWKAADIVLVTDGACRVSPEFAADFNARRKALGVRCQGVLLDGQDSMLIGMEPVCDQVMKVASLAGAQAAKPLFSRFV